jgi:hypothetical protein
VLDYFAAGDFGHGFALPRISDASARRFVPGS